MKLFPPVCLAGIGLLCASCGPSTKERLDAARIDSLKEDVKALQEQVTKAEAASRDARESLREFQDDHSKKQQQNTGEKEAVQKKLDEVQKAFDAYRAKYRVTARAAGQKFALISAGGHEYKDVVVTEVTPGELRFIHSFGTTKLPLGMLDTKLRDHFDYDAMEAETWLAASIKAASGNAGADDDEDGVEGKALASFHARGGLRGLAGAGQPTAGSGGNAGTAADSRKKSYQQKLNNIYTQARQLQADQNCCPVHKRYQLASWQKEANDLKKRIASLP